MLSSVFSTIYLYTATVKNCLLQDSSPHCRGFSFCIDFAHWWKRASPEIFCLLQKIVCHRIILNARIIGLLATVHLPLNLPAIAIDNKLYHTFYFLFDCFQRSKKSLSRKEYDHLFPFKDNFLDQIKFLFNNFCARHCSQIRTLLRTSLEANFLHSDRDGIK